MSSSRATSAAPGAAREPKDSRSWVSALRLPGPERDEAVAALHELLLRAARFEVSRRRAALSHVTGADPRNVAGPANASVTIIRAGARPRLEAYAWTPDGITLSER